MNRLYQTNPQAMAAISRHNDVDVDTWLTPRYVLSELGEFDLDPCAAETNPDWTGAKSVFTKKEDGLSQEWRGRVFMNPPFQNTAQWLELHAQHGCGISLVPATVESIVWRKYVWPLAKGILFTHGRMRFCRPDGSTTTGRPLRSIALIAWTEADAEILRRSKMAGVFISQWSPR